MTAEEPAAERGVPAGPGLPLVPPSGVDLMARRTDLVRIRRRPVGAQVDPVTRAEQEV